MERRQFFKYSLSSLVLGSLFHQAKAVETPHIHVPNVDLLPENALVSGHPFKPLAKLTNESTNKGEFVAELTAEECAVQLTHNTAPTTCYTYNQQVPGPLIELEAGMKVRITFINNLKVPSTIHWHGLPVPSDQDGGPDDPVAPGTTKVYTFQLPDSISGTYWYHPHPLEGAAEQVAKGLVGPIVIRDPQESLGHLPEVHWVISDLRLDSSGKVPPHNYADWVDGREGEHVLLNGQHKPHMTLTSQQRVRIWNMCSARYLNLSLPGCQLIQIGSDGGLIEKALPPQHDILLSPAERMEVLITGESGEYAINLLPYNRHPMMSKPPEIAQLIAKVNFKNEAAPIAANTTLRVIEPLQEGTNVLRVIMSEKMADIMKNKGGIPPRAFLINGKDFDLKRMDLHSQVGKVDHWQIINATTMDHPFHIHGGQFQVVQRAYRGQKTAPECLAWKDTINVRPGETVHVLMIQDKPGMRMFHCHIIEHEELGMMGNLMVI
ncbi:multicopper oxidase family protein [Yersinia massiliensis]|uniref:multicopper oxidase family protein n=1 Tax=Yersinia massiliensis TaxID=419257 RepID=UPI0011A8F4D9|nr:multicopper oxidase family protein [Yersinia massiliensis]MCB5309664.1 multicopper oxidase family protein [Yersinia massiliensis]